MRKPDEQADRGDDQIRTGVRGFAGLCLTTRPRRQTGAILAAPAASPYCCGPASLTTKCVKGHNRTVHTVSEILSDKGGSVIQIDGGATVFDAVKAMVEANVGALLVTDGEEIAGIFTERDYLRRIAVEGRRSRDTFVREVMSAPVICVTPDTQVDETMAMMSDRRIRHAPVVEDGSLIGMISIGDLVKFTSKRQTFQIQYLTDYISAR
jgi:CBS domain-containing protein